MSSSMSAARRVKAAPRNQEWLLALLPVFPLVLLVMRLWYAGGQDSQALLLLLQNVSPLGLLSTAVLASVWMLPALVLGGRLFGTLYWISTRRSSWLVHAAERLPGWVMVLAVVIGVFSWQLRFLPTLATLTMATVGLTVRDRFPKREGLRAFFCHMLPVATAILFYSVLWPTIVSVFTTRDLTTLILLTLPPGATIFLTGPVPKASARMLTHGVAVAIAAFTPFLVGVTVMRAPILPLTALQVEENGVTQVIVGYLVASDDNTFTVLRLEGGVRFVSRDGFQSRVLCSDLSEVPRTSVDLYGWDVEQNMTSWLAPPDLLPLDPRCEGKPGRHTP
ncbi:hypothetical protein ACIBF6_43925 [Streptosporangium amethystogenes]|uniref:hypothetical protein n=1 Tax=Streptosporangium amethystogenes TaxID=2002 RepID=UPI00378DDFC1